METSGQVYFGDDVPEEDARRFRDAELFELQRRAQAEKDARLIAELQRRSTDPRWADEFSIPE